ncbi:hypothetical protein MPER_13221 [Moniliophthora perniciosa FA553]|nr:hypothetical protein MPER_13221 [Moniliophthora perniciosa FA553]
MIQDLRKTARNTPSNIIFSGYYCMAVDPLMSDRERVNTTMMEVWKATGYRFTVHDHPKLATGYKTRAWCSQDASEKKSPKPKQGVNVKHRDHPETRRISIYLEHHLHHTPYYDVSMPDGAVQIIRDNIETSTPSSLVPQIQRLFRSVSAAQVHKSWTTLSEELWKRAKEQLPSVLKLLAEYKDDVDVFEVATEEGVQQVCWGLKKIARPLLAKKFLIEIALDATSTAISPQKRMNALKNWTTHLRDKYGIKPRFVHLDKDMAEIGMVRQVWPEAKIQLCWWHLRRAVRERLGKSKLSTTPYQVQRAHQEFSFINPNFTPYCHGDRAEYEGGVEDEAENIVPTVNPNSIKVKITLPATQTSSFPSTSTPKPSLRAGTTSAVPPITSQGNTTTLKIKIPARTRHVIYDIMPEDEDFNLETGNMEEDDSTSQPLHARRIFCPEELRSRIVDMMETHLNAHPMIPGYSAPTAEGIRYWAVKQMYQFCEEHDLREVWAYLWENWYRPKRWNLWARSVYPEIPHLKTTMILESHWRRIKHDFLHHFHMPRLDLLAWVLITKLAPMYYRKLDLILHPIGRFRDGPSWRKQFKREWKKAEKVTITYPINPKYNPDAHRWSVEPVPPTFFLEVTRNRTSPIWKHPFLVPLRPPTTSATDENIDVTITFNDFSKSVPHMAVDDQHDDSPSEESDNESLVDTIGALEENLTFEERMKTLIHDLHSFADGLEYQIQFRDCRMLTTVEKRGAGFIRVMNSCLSRERRMNSTRGPMPTTWEEATMDALYYRARPRQADQAYYTDYTI